MKLVNYFLLIFSISILLIFPDLLMGQKNSKYNSGENKYYFYWGYNRSWYTDSDIHFGGPNYDITFYNLKAIDRPTPLSWDYINPSKFSVPQYNYRFGYRILNSFYVSFGVDHMKYVVEQNQLTTLSGVISSTFSEKYGGSYLNSKINLEADLLQFEHTDGFNLVSFDFEYLFDLNNKNSKNIHLAWDVGMGGIWVVTKTDVKVLNDGLDNDFHVAGFSFQGKTGPRIEYKNKFFLQSEFKSGYVSLPFILIKNAEPEQGNQNLVFFEYYFVFGINF